MSTIFTSVFNILATFLKGTVTQDSNCNKANTSVNSNIGEVD